MKKIYRFFFVALASLSLISCDALFDNIEGDLSKMSAEDMVSSEAGMKAILANLYGYMPMGAFSTADQNTMQAASSRSAQSIGTGGVSGFWSYSQIRSINKFIEALDSAVEKGIISQQLADSYKGEALFIRAYCYFAAVRVYGGIPIVEEVLDSKYDGGANEGLYIPRKTEKESWDWVLEQLQVAADLLPETQVDEMRINKYAALALRARAALFAASVSKYWKEAEINAAYNAVTKKLTYMEASYADAYYQEAIKSAEAVIKSGKYVLVGANPSSPKDAQTNLENLFQTYNKTEGILGRCYVTGSGTDSNGIEPQAQGGWFMTNAYLSGTYAVTGNLADAYDNYDANYNRVDGMIQTLTAGDTETSYITGFEDKKNASDFAAYKRYDNVTDPFENKDARFKAWVIYPGCEFRGGIINIQGGMINGNVASVYPTNNDGVEKNGVTYYPFGSKNDSENYCFYKLNIDINNSNRNEYGFWVKKFLDLNGWNPYNQAPWYDIRYAEVLLTYAEAVAESGKGDKALAKQCLNDVRHRAAFKDDIELTVENVLHEFKVEFAFENKWSSVLFRRRAFYNPDKGGNNLEGHTGNKMAIVPMVDISGDTAKYIFVRAVPYTSDPKRVTSQLQVKPEAYYSSIPNWNNNKIDDNNK